MLTTTFASWWGGAWSGCARRESERVIADLAEQDSELIAKGLILLARQERDRLGRELRERFRFVLSRREGGYVLRFEGGRPRTPEQATRWVDLFVHAVAFEGALRAMRAVATYYPEPDRARMVCNAFLDVMRDAPGALYGAIAEASFEPAVGEYAEAMRAAWARSHLHKGFSPQLRRALGGEDWEIELMGATRLAWAKRDPDAPLKRGTRFRDMLPRQKDGRRQRAPGPDFVNEVSKVLEGRSTGEKPEPKEIELALFSELEKVRETALRRGREAGLPPREMQLVEVLASNPGITNRAAGELLGIAEGTVKSMKHRIKAADVAV